MFNIFYLFYFRSIFDFTAYENKHAVDDTSGVKFIKDTNWTITGVIKFPDNHPMSYFEELKLEYGMIKAVERYS